MSVLNGVKQDRRTSDHDVHIRARVQQKANHFRIRRCCKRSEKAYADRSPVITWGADAELDQVDGLPMIPEVVRADTPPSTLVDTKRDEGKRLGAYVSLL